MPAGAAQCGDQVGGERVACACGDFVVSDTRLQADDPVVASRCRGDGLIVRADIDASSIRLDLGGQTIMGTGRGVGIRLLRGGATGAVIVGGGDGQTGIVANFGTGIRASNPRVLAQLSGIRVSGNTRDGAYVRSREGLIAEISAEHNGRDGVRIGGRTPHVQRIDASHNGRYGVVATGRGTAVDARGDQNTAGDVRTRMAQ